MRYLISTLLLAAAAPAFSDDFTTVDLRPYFDNDGISFVTNLVDGDFNFQCSYPAEEMPEPGLGELGGIPFDFPRYDDGVNNCVKLGGKSITLPERPAAAIYVLGSALYSRHTTAPATLYYADGESERHLVMLGGTEHGNVEVLKTTVRHVQNRIADGGGWPMYVTAVYPQRDVPLKAIVFDEVFSGVQAFGITLSSAVPHGKPAGKLPLFGLAAIDWGGGIRGANRARASIAASRDLEGELQVEWSCRETEKANAVPAERARPMISPFDYKLMAGTETVSLAIADGQGRKITVSRRVSIPQDLVVRTERPVVLGDSAPIETEVLVNADMADSLVVEIVSQDEGKDGAVVDTREITPVDRRSHAFRFSADKTPMGDYKVRARLNRGDEEVAEAESRLILRRRRPEEGVRKVRFDTDGMMLVDGKRTFPVGMLANFGEDDVAEFKKTGMNCVMLGWPTTKRQAQMWDLFDAVHKAGIFVIGSAYAGEDLSTVRRMTNIQREHPAVIGYHFLEEPGAHFCDRPNGIEIIHRSYQEVRRLDPHHFVDLIDWSAYSYKRYGVFADVITPDRYTRGPKPTPNIVKTTIRQITDAREASRGQKPVWIMPQMFSFVVEGPDGLSDDPSIPEGPTPEQVRLSAYASIVGGAKGILFFEYRYARATINGKGGVSWEGPDNLWDASKHVLTELAQLRPVLEAKGKSRTVPATDGIETWAKAHEGWWTIIAVNSTERPLAVAIDVSELNAQGPPEVLFEQGRKCGFADGRIRDDFSAAGAHVYRIPTGD